MSLAKLIHSVLLEEEEEEGNGERLSAEAKLNFVIVSFNRWFNAPYGLH